MHHFVALSIETHLFFARIMREHALFLEAGFPCKEEAWIQKADWFRAQFESLLRDALTLASGHVRPCVVSSNEFVTEFTVSAERKTVQLSGIPIDSTLSEQAKLLSCQENIPVNRAFLSRVVTLNRRALHLLGGLISFKEQLLTAVQNCSVFNANYPLLIAHILREAKLYRSLVEDLMSNRRITKANLLDTEIFWNQIMMEHALFIRGLLDPCEETLIDTADDFATDYQRLLELAKRQEHLATEELTKKSIEETSKYRSFKASATSGILDCKISAVILPLLADHVLREANHYLRLLTCNRVG